jgi:hypothetical protein
MTYSGSSSARRAPRPLQRIVEEAPIRERTCDRCGDRYAVFGEHVACPVCGPHLPKAVATDAFDAQEAVRHYIDDHVQRLASAGRPDLCDAFERWCARDA